MGAVCSTPGAEPASGKKAAKTETAGANTSNNSLKAVEKKEGESAPEKEEAEPPFTDMDVWHVQRTWDLVCPLPAPTMGGTSLSLFLNAPSKPEEDELAAKVGFLFYENLFQIAPAARALFPDDLARQETKLAKMLNATVGLLNRLDVLVPVLQDLGRRHIMYGAEDAHFDPVGAALLKTLEQALGDEWTEDVSAAWTKVYGTAQAVMTAAMQEERDAAKE